MQSDICYIRLFEYVIQYIQDYEYEKATHFTNF